MRGTFGLHDQRPWGNSISMQPRWTLATHVVFRVLVGAEINIELDGVPVHAHVSNRLDWREACYVNSGGSIDLGTQNLFIHNSGERPYGIWTSGKSDVNVVADGNVNINGSRIASLQWRQHFCRVNSWQTSTSVAAAIRRQSSTRRRPLFFGRNFRQRNPRRQPSQGIPNPGRRVLYPEISR